tara:strand:+ start:385 stop:720 length:336 start_codon:yes stop_codon:yes gene_type:complete
MENYQEIKMLKEYKKVRTKQQLESQNIAHIVRNIGQGFSYKDFKNFKWILVLNDIVTMSPENYVFNANGGVRYSAPTIKQLLTVYNLGIVRRKEWKYYKPKNRNIVKMIKV